MRVNGTNLAGSGSPQFGSYFRFEPYGGEWADIHFPEDPAGNIYKGIQVSGLAADLTPICVASTDPHSYQDGRYIKRRTSRPTTIGPT